jgi:hypothetical protein
MLTFFFKMESVDSGKLILDGIHARVFFFSFRFFAGAVRIGSLKGRVCSVSIEPVWQDSG